MATFGESEPVAGPSPQNGSVNSTGSAAARNPDLRRKTVAAILLLLILSIAFWSCFEERGAPMDEGSLLVYPELVGHGAVPYRDFETFYGPANLWSLATMYGAFGTTVTVERATGLLYRLLILLALFCLTQRWGTTPAVGCTLLAGCMILVTGLAASAWIGAMACALWYVWIATTGDLSLRRGCGAGFTAGLALLFRVDLAPAVLLASVPLWFSLTGRQRWMMLLTGGAIALLPLVPLTLLAGPEQVANNLFIFPVLRSSPGRHLPLSAVRPFLVHLVLLHLLATFVNLFAGFIAAKGTWRQRRTLALLMATLLGVGITHQALQRLDMIHLAAVAVFSIALLPLSLAVITSKWRPASGAGPAAALGATVGVALMVAITAPQIPRRIGMAFRAGLTTAPANTAVIEKGGRWFVIGGQKTTAVAIERMLEQLDQLSTAGQRLFVGPNDLRRTNYCDTFIYHLMPKLRPATYFLEMNPLSANRPGSRLADDVASADFLVLNALWDRSDEPNRSGENGSDLPNSVVRENFVPIGQYGTYTLYRRTGAG